MSEVDRIVVVVDDVRHEIFVPQSVAVVTVQVDQGNDADSYIHVARDRRKPRGERRGWREYGFGSDSRPLEAGDPTPVNTR